MTENPNPMLLCWCMCGFWFSIVSQGMRWNSCFCVKPHGSLKMEIHFTQLYRQIMIIIWTFTRQHAKPCDSAKRCMQCYVEITIWPKMQWEIPKSGIKCVRIVPTMGIYWKKLFQYEFWVGEKNLNSSVELTYSENGNTVERWNSR